jgi:hypothetical protein
LDAHLDRKLVSAASNTREIVIGHLQSPGTVAAATDDMARKATMMRSDLIGGITD